MKTTSYHLTDKFIDWIYSSHHLFVPVLFSVHSLLEKWVYAEQLHMLCNVWLKQMLNLVNAFEHVSEAGWHMSSVLDLVIKKMKNCVRELPDF